MSSHCQLLWQHTERLARIRLYAGPKTGWSWLRLAGLLAHAQGSALIELREHLSRLPPRLFVEASQLEDLPSSALALLCGIAGQLRRRGGGLVLFAGPTRLTQLLTSLDLNTLLGNAPDWPSACLLGRNLDPSLEAQAPSFDERLSEPVEVHKIPALWQAWDPEAERRAALDPQDKLAREQDFNARARRASALWHARDGELPYGAQVTLRKSQRIDWLQAELSGNFDRAHIEPLAQLRSKLEALSPKVLLDLRELSFIASRALGHLIALADEAAQRGGKAIAFAPRPKIRSLLEVLGLDLILELVNDEATALQCAAIFEAQKLQ